MTPLGWLGRKTSTQTNHHKIQQQQGILISDRFRFQDNNYYLGLVLIVEVLFKWSKMKEKVLYAKQEQQNPPSASAFKL